MRAVLRRTKSIKGLEKKLEKNGWTCRDGKHHVWKCGCGEHIVTLPKTVRGDHTLKNYAKIVDRNWCQT